MKKMLIAIIILLLIVIFLLLYCNCRKKCVSCDDNKKPAAESCSVFCYTPPNGELEGMIDYANLAKMSFAYFSDAGKSKITGTTNDDALSMVFDLDKIKTLIWQMEKRACSLDCKKVKLGIRYYYVKYPSTLGTAAAPDCLDGISAIEKNKHALVMVPVWWDAEHSVWRDYNLWERSDSCFPEFPPKNHGDSLRIGIAGTNGEGGDNHGGIGPPPGRGFFPSSGSD